MLTQIDKRIFEISISSFNDHQSKDQTSGSLLQQIKYSEEAITLGFADDLNLSQGLESILDLIVALETTSKCSLFDLICLKNHLTKWLNSVGLDYDLNESMSLKDQHMVENLLKFRENVRIESLKALLSKGEQQEGQVDVKAKESLKQILNHCDQARKMAQNYGYFIADQPFKQT